MVPVDELAEMLVKQARLPAIGELQPLTGPGMDNQLTRITLVDGQMFLLRAPHQPMLDSTSRARFLATVRAGAPATLAVASTGATLTEWVAGVSLADTLSGSAPSRTAPWRRVGRAMAAVHAVEFPLSLEGEVGPQELVLRAGDPVGSLRETIERGLDGPAATGPGSGELAGRLGDLVDEHAARIRHEKPRLLHGDVNFDNIIVREDSATFIDWDFPRVGHRLTELSALDEHAYLNDLDQGLPDAFWSGYGERFPDTLLLVYRAAGCLNWLAADNWAVWEQDTDLPTALRSKLLTWHARLINWVDQLPRRLAEAAEA